MKSNELINKETVPTYDYLFTSEEKDKTEKVSLIKKLFKKDLGKILISTFIYLLKNAPVWIVPIVVADVIDKVTVRPEGFINNLIIDAVIFFVVLIQNIFTHYLYAKIVDGMLRETNDGIKMTIIRKLQHLSITYYKEMESGTIQSKFLRDVDNVDNYYRNIIKVVIPAFIGLFVSIGISLSKSWMVTLFFLVIVPVNMISIKFFKNKLKRKYHDFRVDSEDLSNSVSKMLSMLSLTKAHGLETTETISLQKRVKKVTNSGLEVDKEVAWFGSINWVIGMLLDGLCLFFTVFLCIKNYISVGDVVLFKSLFSAINNGVLSIINAFPVLATGSESANSLAEIINSKDLEKHLGHSSINEYKGKIEFKNVTFSFPNPDKKVLNNVSFVVKPGESIAVVGSSGGGKTTLMNLLMGLLTPTSGQIFIDDIDLDTLDIDDYRHHISVVPQNSILFAGTLKENITYGLNSYTDEELNDAVEQANIKEFLDVLPNGLNSQVGERGDKLSGGQRQRIAIARALIRHPSILILDEATSALDNISEAQVEKAIANLTKKCTTFIVAHRLSTIKNTDRVIVLDKGQIVQIGAYNDLSKIEGPFKELLKLTK